MMSPARHHRADEKTLTAYRDSIVTGMRIFVHFFRINASFRFMSFIFSPTNFLFADY